MLKTKFNINEFTIIFLRWLEGKRMLKRSRSSSQFSVCLPFCSASFFFFFLFSFGTPLFLFSPKMSSPFSHYVLPFSAQVLPFFSPKCVDSKAQKSLPVCACIPFSVSASIKTQRDLLLMPTSKAKNILFGCFSIFYLNKSSFSSVGANWPQRYYSGWEGWAYGPITQSKDEDIFEDDKLRKRWTLYYGKR